MDTIPVAFHILNGDLTNGYIGSNIISIAAKLINTTSIMKLMLIACGNCYILHLK